MTAPVPPSSNTDLEGQRELLQRALRDPYYREMVKRGASAHDLMRAGFFVDSLATPVQDHPSWALWLPTSPVGKLFDRAVCYARKRAPLVVLLSTGSFSPVHQGHISLMESAAKTLEAQGFSVLGGYLSPSHDQYVSAKQGGLAAMHCESRIELLEAAVADHPWLAVCPWEARYAPVALNFTDVIRRLQDYLKTHLVPHLRLPATCEIQVAYVFGSDNLRFVDAFLGQGLAVCVERSGYGLGLSESAWPAEQGRLFRAKSGEHSDASSTRVRNGEQSLLPSAIRNRYSALRSGSTNSPTKPLYLVRQDLPHAMCGWGVDAEGQQAFEQGLSAVLANALSETRSNIHWLQLSRQQELALQWQMEGPVLSLDACVPGTGQLQLSRRFDLCDGQVRSQVMVQRPGSPSICQQLDALPRQVTQWGVVDDDTSSGQTERYVRALLASKKLDISGVRYLNEHLLKADKWGTDEVLDIVDARDFLLGAQDGGLVVRLPNGELARAPYAFPFVNLRFRACIPSPNLSGTSKAIWRLNRQWFQAYAPGLRVCDASVGSQALLRYLGFSPNTTLGAVCARVEASLFCGYPGA